jgi:hypothetical protein
MSVTVDDGAMVVKDPSDSRVYDFDWGAQHLATGVAINTSTFTITAISPVGDAGLTKDNESIVSPDNRVTRVRLIGGTLGAKYRLDNRIVTNEATPQTIERSIVIKVEQK